MKPAISVVINTLNEEKNLPYALRSVRDWADEIIVVDMHSEDRTVEIARQYGAKIYYHERIPAFDGARRFAINQASNDWVLLLDADELIPEPLSHQLKKIAANNATDIVLLPRINYLLGAPVNHTGWGPAQDRQPRFFRKKKIQISDRVHAFLRPVSGARIFTPPYRRNTAIVHFAYKDATHFLEKLNRYTTIEAQQAYERGEQATFFNAIYRPLKEFLIRYFWKKGYRDGWRGFYLSGLMALYQWATLTKLKEMYFISEHGEASDRYKNAAEEIIADYRKPDIL